MNITEESKGLEALLKQAEQQDKTNKVEPQCNLEDGECLSCGS